MSKIRVIDLLNRIINDENYRPTVRFDNITYRYDKIYEDYENNDNDDFGLFSDYCINKILNDEVEILDEEKKIPEKLIPTALGGIDDLNEKIKVAHIDTISTIGDEIIDYLKNKGDEQDMKEQKIEITLEEYKELLEIKGKYEEIKKHPIIQYVYVYDTKPYVDITPKITWKVD